MRRPLLLSVVLLLLATAPANAAYSYSISKITPRVKERIDGDLVAQGLPGLARRTCATSASGTGTSTSASATGELIVNRDAAGAIVRVFRQLYKNDYRIRRMRLVDDYGANDFRSIEADNTSAFNCRFVDGTTRWSNHAFGRAIDVNPIENPYVTASGTHVAPPPAASTSTARRAATAR